jgi:ABC-type phosphate transport system substrate-binding protein
MCFAAPVIAGAQAVRVQASDIIVDPVKGILDACPSPKVTVSFEGSVNALAALREGRADLAIIAVPDGQPLPADLVCKPLVFDVATVVVNDSNPLTEINLRTLAMVLARSSASSDKWGVLGLKDPWASRSITVYLPDASNGITLPLLRSMTVISGKFSDSAGVWTTKDQMEHIVREQPSSIVVMRGNNVPGGGRALGISLKDGKDQFAYRPTQDSVFYGDYPLRLPFYIAVRKDAPQPVLDLEKVLLSDASATLFDAAGFVPVPVSERN